MYTGAERLRDLRRAASGAGKGKYEMKALIVGGGGREHAIAVSMKKSSRVEKIYCVPGNAGIAQIAECEPSIGVMEFDRIVAYALSLIHI